MTVNIDKRDSVEDGPRFLRYLRARFSQLTPGDHKLVFSVGGLKVHFKARIVDKPTQLLFTFHGAVNRDTRHKIPFNGFFPGLANTNQVALSDPSLGVSPDFRIGWFAGHRGFDTQYHLRGALRTIAKALGGDRTIYFGTSGGGFAALYYSFFAPKAVALVFNPQTNIPAYHSTLVTPYREACWPDLTSNDQLADVTCTNLPQLYATGFRNTIVYCQSMGDRHHATTHMLPFLGALAGQSRSRRVMLHSDFAGDHGHVSDHAAYLQWARAIAASPTDEPKDLLDTWHANRSKGGPVPARPVPAPRPARAPAVAAAPAPAAVARAVEPQKGFRAEDIALAERVRAYREAQR